MKENNEEYNEEQAANEIIQRADIYADTIMSKLDPLMEDFTDESDLISFVIALAILARTSPVADNPNVLAVLRAIMNE